MQKMGIYIYLIFFVENGSLSKSIISTLEELENILTFSLKQKAEYYKHLAFVLQLFHCLSIQKSHINVGYWLKILHSYSLS